MPKKNSNGDRPLWQVMESGIHNRGVFARKNIEPETDIIQYVGERLSHKVADARGLAWEAKARKSGVGAVYLFTLNEKWVIDGNTEDNPARLINHSCDPNCEAIIYGEGGEAEIWLVSKKRIRKGEELTFDYGFDAENYEDHPCLCGSKNCVGYIVGEEYRADLELFKQKKSKKAKKKNKGKSKKKAPEAVLARKNRRKKQFAAP